jgi:AcrR family transcriptional regulator
MSDKYGRSPSRVKRRYDAPRRQAKAAETRRRVVQAATELFLERGYEAATADEIASLAGVSRPTVFVSVGGKPELLKQVRDLALAGDDEPVPMPQRRMFRELWDERDATRAVHLYARNMRIVHGRAAGIEAVLQHAPSSDPGLRDLAEEATRQRRHGCRTVVDSLRDKAPMRGRLTAAAAADIVFTLASPETYLHLVRTCRWTPRRYQAWLSELLQRELYD